MVFLGVWENLCNPDFNRVQFEADKSEAGLNRFVMTASKWIEQMNAIGMMTKTGRFTIRKRCLIMLMHNK